MNAMQTAVLDLLRGEYTRKLAEQCGVFVTIGSPEESPRWIIYNGTLNKHDAGGLLLSLAFSHSQVNHIWFFVSLESLTVHERNTVMSIRYDDILDYFRKVKYAYLAEHWPTIDIPEEYQIVKDAPVELVRPINKEMPNILDVERDDEPSEYEKEAEEFLTRNGMVLTWEFDRFDKYFDSDTQKRNIFKWTISRDNKCITGTFGSSIFESCKIGPALYSEGPCEIYWGIKVGEGKEAMYLSHTINTSYDVLRKVNSGEIKAASLIDTKKLVEDHTAFLAKREARAKQLRMRENMSSDFIRVDMIKTLIIERIIRAIWIAKNENKARYEQDDKIKFPSAYDLLASIVKYPPGTFENFCSDYGYDTDSRKAYKIYNTVLDQWKDVESFMSGQEISELESIN